MFYCNAARHQCFEQLQADLKILGEIRNREAWEASYQERGLSIPESGPREGYWGKRLGPKQKDKYVSWREPRVYVEGLLDIDDNGYQYSHNGNRDGYRIVIFGGSVAFGAYASAIDKAYFSVIESRLSQPQIDASITIVAAGAWKSVQELAAWQQYLQSNEPDLVIFLNGLNDITNGPTASALYGQQSETVDGSEWTLLYHDYNYIQRINLYLKHMKLARSSAVQTGTEMLVVLQPVLFERKKLTDIEDSLLEASLAPLGDVDLLQKSYDSLRFSLSTMSKSERIFFLDSSRAFDAEEETTFSDL